MATRIIRTGEPQDVSAYLNSFLDDRLRYIIDPNDSRQVIVENQKIFESSSNLSIGQTFQLSTDEKTYFCKVTAKSIWNPSLILVEGQQIHTLKDEIGFNPKLISTNDQKLTLSTHDQNPIAAYKKLQSTSSPKADLKSLASNIITIISSDSPPPPPTPLDRGAAPTRNSPDDGMPTPPPTRNSDGTRTPDPTRNSPAGYGRPVYAEENIPLTEYWLNCAQKHNDAKSDKPIVAIMDTGIDFRYDWTMSHEKIASTGRGGFLGVSMPDCPLWFNENDTGIALENEDVPSPTSVPILQKDYIGWNFVGTGRLYSNQHPNPYDDDSASKHGTRIAAIIAQQTDWNVRLMILKTHDYRGVGLLFNIFCAFDYLLQRSEGVKIVNASWGYYGAPNTRLQQYIRDLEAKSIWFVNAAGNQSDFYDDYHGHELKTGTPTERYPACFSLADNLVTTITTAKNRLRIKAAPPAAGVQLNWQTVENYSNQFVDVAVGAGNNGTFPEPLADNQATIKGSSYATAYFSGRLVRYLAAGGTPSSILGNICQPIPNSEFSVLGNRVRNGYFLFADMDFVEEAY